MEGRLAAALAALGAAQQAEAAARLDRLQAAVDAQVGGGRRAGERGGGSREVSEGGGGGGPEGG